MQYSVLALAIAATAFAQSDADSAISAAESAVSAAVSELPGVISVLATALPSSLVSEYATNSAAVESDLSSAFAAGSTPSWFQALPTSVQTYLLPAFETGVSNATATTASNVSGAPTVIVNSTGNSTLASTQRTPSMTGTTSTPGSETMTAGSSDSSSGSGSSSDSSGSSSTSSGGASVPTAVVGMGLAGVAGLVGVLAL